MKLKKLVAMTRQQLVDLARNPNVFGSMLARYEVNRRNRREGLEPEFLSDRLDHEQYKRELYSVEWID
jgi:hypothetical protein